MATKKISELQALTTADDSDVLVVVDVSEGKTKKITKGNLLLETGHTIEMSLNPSTYVLTLSLKNAAGTVLNTQTVNFPNENAITGIRYSNGSLIITKQSGMQSEVNISGLINGLQQEITNNNKLSSDLVDDTEQTNKFVTSTEKNTWDAKYDKPNTGIPKTDLASDVQTSLGKADTAIQSHQDITGKEDKSNKVTELTSSSTNTQYPGAKAVYDELTSLKAENAKLTEELEEERANDLTNSPEKATSLHITDSANAKFRRFLPEGHSEQETTEGYNQYYMNYNNVTNTFGGVTIISTKTGYSLNGTRTSTSSSAFTLINRKLKLSAGTYTLKLKKASVCKVGLSEPDYTPVKILAVGTISGTFTLNEATDVCMTIGFTDSGDYNEENELMIYSGTEDKPFEEYTFGASPNPSYEQSIKSAGENVNLFNKNSTFYDNLDICTATVLNTGVRITSKISRSGNDTNVVGKYMVMDLKGYEGKTIIVNTKAKSSSSNPAFLYLRIVAEDYSTSSSFPSISSQTTLDGVLSTEILVPSTLDATYHFLTIALYADRNASVSIGDYVDYTDLKIEEKTSGSPTPYSPYGMGSINEKIVNKNLAKLNQSLNTDRSAWTYTSETPENITASKTGTEGKFFAVFEANIIKGQSYILKGQQNIGNIYAYSDRIWGTTVFTANPNIGKTFTASYTGKLILGTYTSSTEEVSIINFQLELGSTASDYIPNQEQTYSMPTQQPFRSSKDGTVRDKFVKVNGTWYERHFIQEMIADGVNYKPGYVFPSGRFNLNDTNGQITYAKATSNNSIGNVLCSRLIAETFTNLSVNNKMGISLSENGTINLKLDDSSDNSINNWTKESINLYLAENPFVINAELADPTLLPCTQSQINILENLLSTYKTETNVISLDEVEAFLDTEYVQDLRTVIDSLEARVTLLEG